MSQEPPSRELAPSSPAAVVVLAGEQGDARSAVVVNAAAALLVGGVADSWEEGARLAETSIDEGGAAHALQRLRACSKRDSG